MKTGLILGFWALMSRFRVFFLVLLLVWPASPWAGAEENPPAAAGEAGKTGSAVSETVRKKKIEKLELGDRVLVKIFPEDEYIKGGAMVVSSEGDITLPLIGKIRVEGLQIVEAEKKILELLAADYLVNPVVVIEVTKDVAELRKSLSILGQVQKPGSYQMPLEDKLTLLQLISMAGGFTDVANVKKIKVIRKAAGKIKVIHANAESIIGGKDPDIELAAEDVIHVGESLF